ncbi:hypothetical protein ACH4M4_28865 [Streptomyces sp. NPDC017254]|uniref:hypothetical protein n=1 Tax=unclassified Streptomyces TaxID=2593676 RepID=UPI0037879455
MSGTHTCPGCGQNDRVQAVPAVYLGGRDTVMSRERDSDGDMRTVTRTATTGLSEALAPAPRPPAYTIGCLGVLAAAVAVGTFLGGAIAGKWFQDEPADEPPVPNGWYPQDVPAEPPLAYGFLAWISAFALLAAVLVFTRVYRRKARFTRLMRGRHRAAELWSRGWYCHRCGTVHFVDVPGEDRRPLTLQGFRERVWEHGGYGDLAAEQRALAALDD